MARKRSNSFDGSTVQEDELPISELEAELAQRMQAKRRKKPEGYVHIRQQSWLGLCCALSSVPWRRKYLMLTQDKVLFCTAPGRPTEVQIDLDRLMTSVTASAGHNNSYNCLQLQDTSQKLEVSFENRDDFEFWLGKLQSPGLQRSAFFYT